MKRLSALLGTALLVLLAASASQARADYLNWSYTTALPTNFKGVSVDTNAPTGGASVSLSGFDNPTPPATGYAGAASIPVLAYVTSTSVAPPGISFTGSPSYNLALTITDGTTHDSGTLNFTGTIAGSLSAAASGLQNTLTPLTTSKLTLDGHTYTVSIPNADLLAPNSPQTNIMASVSVSDASVGGNIVTPAHGTPEPTSLLLGGLGVSCVGAGCLWKRRLAVRRRPQQEDEDA